MTFEEIDKKLPNTFHDAKIRTINVDFMNCTLSMGMDLHVGLEDSPDPEAYRAGTLKLSPLYLFFMEPPDPRPCYHFIPHGSAFRVDNDSVRKGNKPEMDRLLPVLPADSTMYRLFLVEWNAFIYMAGGSVEFSWDDGGSFD